MHCLTHSPAYSTHRLPLTLRVPVLAVALVLGLTLATSGEAQDIAISNIESLSFGSFVAGTGGSVTVTPSGTRHASGAVLLVPSSQGLAATFTVTGSANATYTVQLPGNGFVELTGPGENMLINDFTSNPEGAGGQLDAGGSQTLSVGGALQVGSGQPPGAYSGSFTVTVDYN